MLLLKIEATERNEYISKYNSLYLRAFASKLYRATNSIFLPKPNAFELTRKTGAA